MILGYNTNGFAHHRLSDALTILAELGYRGVALTPDVNHLDPSRLKPDLDRVAVQLSTLGLQCVIETGARFVLDARRKHQPTLLSATAEERDRRLKFLLRCLRIARRLGSPTLSFWSGTPTDSASPREYMDRLVDGCRRLADEAAKQGIRLAFEPEPGMFIDTMDRFAELHTRVNHPSFGLTLDAGHLVCQRELPISQVIRDWQHCLWNLHVEDMKPGVHDHLMFGEGEVDFADLFSALRAIHYEGMLSVELSRHSFNAVEIATRSKAFLDLQIGERGA